jgi:anti-sigma-K factor RskA
MNHEPYDTLAATYAVGALDGQERVDFERHLAGGCDVCEATLRESAEALATLARSRPPMIPPPAVKEELMRRIAATTSARLDATRPRPRPLVWAAGTVAAVIAVAAFTGTYVAARYEAQLGVMARESVALRARVEREETALREQLTVYRNAADLLRDPQAQLVTLRGLGPSPGATGRVIWHPVNGGYVFVANLPSAPPGKAYELWTIGDAAPQPAGVFQVDASGRGVLRIAPVDGGKPVKVFAVTLETEAGVQQPEGPMVLASTK